MRKTASSMFHGAIIALSTLFLLFGLSSCKNDSETSKSSGSKGGILSFVPADSIFFVGGLEAISVKESTQMFGENSGFFLQAFKDGMKKAPNPDEPPAFKVVGQLFLDYLEAMSNPEQLAKKLGISDDMRVAFYTVGTMPVMRMQLKDKAAFEAFIQNSETQANTKGEVVTLGSAKVHKYSFEKTPTANSPGIYLVIGTQDDYAIVTVTADKLSDETNRQIVGDIKPASSISTDTLTDLAKKYGFDKRYLFILDHKQIMRGLTHSDNQFGTMLQTFIEMAKKNQMNAAATPGEPGAETQAGVDDKASAVAENPLAKIQTPECQTELTAKVETWPRTVGGYTTLDFKSKPAVFDFKAVVEINDAKFTQSLASLRGVIPSYLFDKNMPMLFGFGLGINVDAIAPFVTQYVQDFTAKDYKCQFLAEMKQEMQASNPAMGIAMMTGMAAGVYGASASLLSFDGNIDPTMQMPPDIKNLQAIVTVSAKNPQMLLMVLSNLQPGMPPIQLPADGKAIDFPIPLPSPEPIKLALKGNHIVAYIGKDAAPLADTMQKQTLQGNGLLTMNIDYQQYFKLLMSGPAAAANAQDPEFQKMMKMFEGMKYRIIEGIDVTDKGIEINAAMRMN